MKKVDDKNTGAHSRRGRIAGTFTLARVLLVTAGFLINAASGAAMSTAAMIQDNTIAKNRITSAAGPAGIAVLTVKSGGSLRYISLREPAGAAGPESRNSGTVAVNRVGSGESAKLAVGNTLLVTVLVGGMVYLAARKASGDKP